MDFLLASVPYIQLVILNDDYYGRKVYREVQTKCAAVKLTMTVYRIKVKSFNWKSYNVLS